MVRTPRLEGLADWRPLARGGFAVVWEARQESLNRLVAVKIINRKLDTPEERDRFLRESGAAGRMSGHPGIVTVHYAGLLDDDRPYLVMELCTGGSLTRLLQPENRPSQEWVRDLGVRIADALAAAHAQGVLHRDVKPGNIIVGGGRARLIDLSLAQAPGLVPAGRGTPSYLSPEQGVGGFVSGASDVWGLGLTLFVAATGVKPFSRGGSTSKTPEARSSSGPGSRNDQCRTCGRRMSYLQLTNRAPRARSLRRMPRTLADALDACLEPSPASRPTLAELDQTFNAVAGTDRPAW